MGKQSRTKHTGKTLTERQFDAMAKREALERDIRAKNARVLDFFVETLIHGS